MMHHASLKRYSHVLMHHSSLTEAEVIVGLDASSLTVVGDVFMVFDAALISDSDRSVSWDLKHYYCAVLIL